MRPWVADACPVRENLRQLALLRAFAVFGQSATVAFVYLVLEVPIPVGVLSATIGALALADIGLWLRLPWSHPVSEGEFIAHLFTDIAVLTVLLYFTGGASNPFVACYVLLVVCAASTLQARYVWAAAVICMFAYALLREFHVPLQLAQFPDIQHQLMEYAHWVNGTLLIALAAFFGVRVSRIWQEHHRRNEMLAELQARDRSLIGLATLAAGAAHEINTPLSTMSVVVGDLRRSEAPPPDWKQMTEVLWRQIQVCKKSIADMVESTAADLDGGAPSMPVGQFLRQLAERFEFMRPSVTLRLHFSGSDGGAEIKADRTLKHGLLNLINNAADASAEMVEVQAQWDDAALVIDILDRGPGITREVREKLGRPFFTKKGPGKGLGMGFFVANKAIERFGGSVMLFNRESGGACARVSLPLARVAASTKGGLEDGHEASGQVASRRAASTG